MHSVPLIFVLLLAMAGSCGQSEEITDPFVQQEIMWKIGAEHSSDTTLQVPVSSSGMATLEISVYSICPTHQLHLKVHADTNQVFLDVLVDDVEMYELSVPPGLEQLWVSSRLRHHQDDVQCVWLGQANLVYSYTE